MLRTGCLAALCLLPAYGYSPPVDTAGPLTVRIEGPAALAQAGPASYSVVIENKAENAVAGRLRMEGIDGWKAEPPAAEFRVGPRSSARVDFTVTPPSLVFPAHYPIHVYAEFPFEGAQLTAHPILVVETKFGLSARPRAALEWKPFEAAPDSRLALWRLPVFRAVIHSASRAPLVMPVGWQGSEPDSRASLQWNMRVDRGGIREGISMHPPYSAGRVGSIIAEIPLKLPSQPVKLTFANAVRTPDPGGKADGVTFRVRVADAGAPEGALGEVIFSRHSNSHVWEEGQADLSRYAGQSIVLQLESHPGPANNTNYDMSYWAEPALIAGSPPAQPAFPPSSEAGSTLLGSVNGYQVRLWPGARGALDAAVGFLKANQAVYFRGFAVRVSGYQLEEGNSPVALKQVAGEGDAQKYRIRHRFADFDLMAELWVDEGGLKTRFWMENAPEPKPWQAVYIEDAAAGAWSAPVRRVYAGVGNVLEEPQAFRLSFDGHFLATSFVGLDFQNGFSLVQAVNLPPHALEFDPARALASLRSAHSLTFTFIPCDDVWAGVRLWRSTNGWKAAEGVSKLAGRFVFDLWGGAYASSAAALRRAAAYGLVDSVVVWHNWQRWGYDYRLPDIYPPNPALGTEADFHSLVRAARESGMLFAPHDNYIDFYPDADGFSYDHISFNASGAPVKAWYNKSRDAQSYRWLTDRFRPFLERNLRLIREGFAPSAYFIDVWSSIGPFDAWSKEGRLVDRVTTRRAWGEAFAWIRNFLGDDAPQISESGHDQLIGWLDGAQANHLRVDQPPPGDYSWSVWNIRAKDAERIPWFDMAHHDRFILHGAGYETRYASGLNREMHGTYSDDYMTTEAMTGHPPMVSEPFSRNAVRKYWLLHPLGRALALREIESVEFAGGDLHRQHIRWSGGGEVWVNRGEPDWAAGNHILPQYGFYARIPAGQGVVEAAIERRGGVIVDWAKSPVAWYANARPVITDRLPFRVSLESLEPAGTRRFTFRFRWEADAPALLPLRVFVHFVDSTGAIRFQGDYAPPVPTTAWQGTVFTSATVTIPEELYQADQVFDVRIGLFDPATGARYLPLGQDDGTRRVRLGSVTVEPPGLKWTPFEPGPDPTLARLNPEGLVIDFEGLATNAAVRLTAAGDSLWITQLPGSAAGVLRLRLAALPWALPVPRVAHVRDEAGNILKTVAFDQTGDEIVLRLEPGVFAYELR